MTRWKFCANSAPHLSCNGCPSATARGGSGEQGVCPCAWEIGAIQSSDDSYLPGAIRAGVDALLSDSALAFAFGDIAKVDANGVELSRTQLGAYSLEGVLTMETWIPQPSNFFRMQLAKSLAVGVRKCRMQRHRLVAAYGAASISG